MLGEVLLCAFVIAVMLFDVLAFAMSYGSPLGTYTGQEDERAVAVRTLLVLVVPGVLLMSVLLWAELRRRGKRRASTAGRSRFGAVAGPSDADRR
ncbi:hypothetical protein ABT187_36445 [Streptomyces sp. NPDC001817]|uniref:hypothetical protein n=1 Tax=Streptomyces sp. NPDC001817 TaxID=3154398 RepID=UPI00332BC649